VSSASFASFALSALLLIHTQPLPAVNKPTNTPV
jgi:hypothetical protein